MRQRVAYLDRQLEEFSKEKARLLEELEHAAYLERSWSGLQTQ